MLIRSLMVPAVCSLVALLASCAGFRAELKANLPVGGTDLSVVVPGGGGATDGTTTVIHADPSMEGLSVRASVTGPDGEPAVGAPTVIKSGPNVVEIPAGMGPPHLTFFLPREPIAPRTFMGPPTPTPEPASTYYFVQIPWAPFLDQPNLSYHLQLKANSLEQAEARQMHIVETIYASLVRGIDPGPLPEYVAVVSFTSWEFLPGSQNTADIVFTSMRPGSRVDEYRLDFNGTQGYATPGNGAFSRTIGDWQTVQALVRAEDVRFPAGPGELVNNEWEIRFDTDVGDMLPNRVECEIEVP
jgi:hypothetical protein